MEKKTLLKKLTLLSCLLLSINLAVAQWQNPLWNFQPNYTKNFGTPQPLPTSSSTYGYTGNWTTCAGPNTAYVVSPLGPNNMYKDGGGNPLFFVNGSLVYNSNGYLIDELYLSNGATYSGTPYDATGLCEVCVIPKPGSCTQYYIFTGGYNDTSNTGTGYNHGYRPYYALIDVAQNNPYTAGQYGKNITSGTPSDGTVCDLFKSTSTPAPIAGYHIFIGDVFYAATKPRGDGSRFLFVSNNDVVFIYKITSSGISYLRQYVTTSLTTSGGGTTSNIGNTGIGNATEMEIYQDDANHLYKLAIGSSNWSVFGSILLANFDTTATFITNSAQGVNITGTNPSVEYTAPGIEFSPNGNYVYFTHVSVTSYPSSVTAFLYSNPATYYNISTDTTFRNSQIEMGADSNLYLVKGTKDSSGVLYKINNSNTPASATLSSALSLTNYRMNRTSYGGGSVASTNYSLPDQIDGEVYGSNFNTANTACCLFYTPFDKEIYYAGQAYPSGWTSTSQTWSSSSNPLNNGSGDTVTIGTMLRIPAGYTVTINNMKIKFSPQARLVIENGTSTKHGGKLILSGCTLTVNNVCSTTDMWPGVQVWGSPGYSQSANTQGYFSATNSIIENAYIGVLVGCDTTSWLSTITAAPSVAFRSQSNHLSFNNSSTYYGGGGIAYLYGTTFLNNQKGVVFYDYNHNTVYSTITTCTFSTNAALLGSGTSGATAIYDAGLYNLAATGLNIYASKFIDTYNSYALTGLYTTNSYYNINQSASVPTSFWNFKYGIYSLNTSGNAATATCKNSIFNTNYYGIYLGYVNNAIIETDTFRLFVSTCTGHCSHPISYGLYLDHSTGYSVRDNYFTKWGANVPTNILYGTIANNTGAHNNRIFRNTFNYMTVGNQAQYKNYIYSGFPSYNAGGGLVYLCNIFTSGNISTADIRVPSSTSANNSGIGTGLSTDTAGVYYLQGTGSAPGSIPTDTYYPVTGGNQFSHTSGGYDYYIDSLSAAFHSNYYWCSGTGTGCGTAYQPITRKNVGSATAASAITCSVNTYNCTGCRESDPLQAMLNQADAIKQTHDSLQNLMDGGSTSSLLALVNGNNNSQAVYSSLNAATPFVSSAVLIAYINSNYPTSDVTQILTACSPLMDNVNKAINSSNLSQGIKSQLATLQQAGDSKELGLILGISTTLSARHAILNDLIRTYIRDTVPANVQKGYALMKVMALELPAKVQVETGIDIHDSVLAANALTQVANVEGQSNFVKLHTILLQNIDKSTSALMKNTSVLNVIQTLAADSSDRLVYYKANALLQTVGLSNYVPMIQDIPKADSSNNNSVVRKAKEENTTVVSVSSQSTLYNSPNPFKESTTVKAVIVEKTQNAFIVITDMVGNEVARYPVQQGENNINVNAGGLNQAVMFCTLVVDGVKIKTNKMVLIK
jgi:hypothetical protein